MNTEVLLGNEVIALGLVEQGCRVVTAYPGTPSSEILPSVAKYKKQFNRQVYLEWSINEKVAFEVALAASWVGLRAAVAMKQVGLNVASDPFFSAAYTGIKGGFIVIPADDPGPYSSQTDQDSRLTALAAKVPVFDPSSPAEARAMIKEALMLSEEFHIPIMLRPITLLCHALQSISMKEPPALNDSIPTIKFQRDPQRWTATPKLRNLLRLKLNTKLAQIEAEFEKASFNYIFNESSSEKAGIIASGVAFHTTKQVLNNLGVELPILKIGTPYPLPQKLIKNFISNYQIVLVLEEPDACVEWQIPNRDQIRGRLDGTVPSKGELSPEVVSSILIKILKMTNCKITPPSDGRELQAFIKDLPLQMYTSRLCPGCAHRSAFFGIKREFGSKAIYPGDIGCYTLGTNLRAVDTVVNMGASVGMAQGFFQANQLVEDKRPILATIGDSTFLHSGVAPLINAVHTGARFVLIILNNHITAMTGFQPTCESEVLADGSNAACKIAISDLVRACGVDFIQEVDPYDHEMFRKTLRQAYNYSLTPRGSVAVVIAKRPCVIYDPSFIYKTPVPVVITEECNGCRYCMKAFECPALIFNKEKNRVDIDYKICVNCGQCINACSKGHIIPRHQNTAKRSLANEQLSAINNS